MEILDRYLTAFVQEIGNQVDDLIFVDLYSGNGIYSLGARKELFMSPALRALSSGHPISKYVFCEKDNDQSHLLKIRVGKKFKGKNITQLVGRPEDLSEKFQLYLPKETRENKVAVFCVCDPFSLDFEFETMTKLVDLGFNIVFPITFILNDRLNFRYYLREGRAKLNNFLGIIYDVEQLEMLESNDQFYRRVVQIYEKNMISLGLNTSMISQKVDSGLMDIQRYSIGFFSAKYSTKAMEHHVRSMAAMQFDLFR